MTNNTDVPIICSLAGGAIDTQSANLPTLLPESKGFFTMIYDNRVYFYILVLIITLSYIGYQLYKRLFTVQKSVDNFQQLHEDFKPTDVPEQLAEKHENEKQDLEDKLKELEQQIMNKQPQRQEPHRQEPQRQEPQRQEPQPKHSQQMIEHNVDYSNQNNRIQNDVNEPRNMEDDNVQQYDLTEGELNNIVKELED